MNWLTSWIFLHSLTLTCTDLFSYFLNKIFSQYRFRALWRRLTLILPTHTTAQSQFRGPHWRRFQYLRTGLCLWAEVKYYFCFLAGNDLMKFRKLLKLILNLTYWFFLWEFFWITKTKKLLVNVPELLKIEWNSILSIISKMLCECGWAVAILVDNLILKIFEVLEIKPYV